MESLRPEAEDVPPWQRRADTGVRAVPVVVAGASLVLAVARGDVPGTPLGWGAAALATSFSWAVVSIALAAAIWSLTLVAQLVRTVLRWRNSPDRRPAPG